MTLRQHIVKSLKASRNGLTVRELFDTITVYPLPSIRRVVREMEHDAEIITTEISPRIRFALAWADLHL